MIIAIDPGKSGGLAVLDNSNSVSCMAMPDTQGDTLGVLRRIKAQANGSSLVCYLEQVGGFVGRHQPGSAMFKFGEGFGFLKGVLQTLGVRLVLVRPQVWQKRFGLGTKSACKSDTEWKNKLKSESQRRFPKLDVTLKTADALLILDYAMEAERQQPKQA